MSAETHLRQTTRDLFTAAEEIRDEDIPKVETERQKVVSKAEEYDGPEGAPRKLHTRYQELTQALKELHGTADGVEHYAEAWSETDTCVFVLEELNGDEYAATVDAVSQQARQQAREDGDLPEGYGRIKALEYGVADIPGGCPPEPGEWPAVVVNDLFEQLNDITAPSGVDLGNESLSEAMQGERAPTETPEADEETFKGELEENESSAGPAAVRNLEGTQAGE